MMLTFLLFPRPRGLSVKRADRRGPGALAVRVLGRAGR
ncbi:hypothetical protein GFS60_07006 (plasmid) [Rhodococcus sp. WAY2]|nr:hypothetical protein GFS60_07006 [Rhodococcus sp. WAY2]